MQWRRLEIEREIDRERERERLRNMQVLHPCSLVPFMPHRLTMVAHGRCFAVMSRSTWCYATWIDIGY